MSLDTQHNHLTEKICLECNRQFTGIVVACPHDGTLLHHVVQDPLIGTTLAGNYEILEVIGHGGMGVVYKARHTMMDRMVAIKMLQAQLIADSMSVKRFQQESKSASRISHPHVITVYDFGISPNGQPYIVMDYLLGVSLADVIKKEGQLGVERSIKILSQACDALEHAHKQGVVHRDLKPTNFVLIDYDEEKDFVKVVDFGVAKLMNAGPEGQRLTQAGEVCGSPVYMSPEQCTGAELDPRSDIYSMGIVIYETLTGKLPILGKTMVDTMSKHISEMPPTFAQSRPDLYIPERLEQVVFKALAKDPNDRHQTMDELRLDLEMAIPRPGKSQVLRSGGGEQAPLEVFLTLLNKMPMLAWAAVFVVIIGGGIWGFNSMKSAPLPQKATAPVAPVQPTTTTQPTTAAPVATTEPDKTGSAAASTSTAEPKQTGVTPPESGSPHRTASSKRHNNSKETAAVEPPVETSTAEPPKPAGRRAYSSYGNVASPEEIVESSPSEPPKPVVHKHKRQAYSSSTTAEAPKPKHSLSSFNPFADLKKERHY